MSYCRAAAEESGANDRSCLCSCPLRRISRWTLDVGSGGTDDGADPLSTFHLKIVASGLGGLGSYTASQLGNWDPGSGMCQH